MININSLTNSALKQKAGLLQVWRYITLYIVLTKEEIWEEGYNKNWRSLIYSNCKVKFGHLFWVILTSPPPWPRPLPPPPRKKINFSENHFV